ncbi:hypothetical protein POM88_040717 [Heracleum sosnowskyi]|uniref:UBN2 domain-containing protein n=1 Tax=Heracleum sosnowskyi TaxID=360622 RepID=A0AAD8HEL7_9APIA|nr:hypothetical protein POM88_040717 [Heracleum sosnowskyi]
MDFNMYGTVAHCTSAKKMWDLIEVLCEGTTKVRKNKKQILVSQYEAFMAQPKEGITEVFERFNKLINELKLYDKHYETEELNMKFLLTLPDHLEPRISSLKERDLTKIGFDVLYGVLKTYELELFQKRSIQAKQGLVANTSCALIADNLGQRMDSLKISQVKIEELESDDTGDETQVVYDLPEEDEFYSIDELDKMENKSFAYMARRYPNIRFKRKQPFKSRFNSGNAVGSGSSNSFNKGKGIAGAVKGGYKSGSVKKDKAYLELEAKYEALLKKQQGKAFIAEGKCWDDSDEEEEQEYSNYALMAFSDDGDSSQVPILTSLDMTPIQYKQTVEDMSTEMFNIHTSMLAANEEIDRLTARNLELTEKNEELELMVVNLDGLKKEVEYLKNKVICAEQIEKALREQIAETELKLRSFKNSSELIQTYHKEHTEDSKVGVGFDYENDKGRKKAKGKGKESFTNKNAPTILSSVEQPIFKKSVVEFDEELLIIKQQLLEEDEAAKDTSSSPESVSQKETKDNLVKSPKAKKEVVKKKKQNRNGKVGVNKGNNYAYVPNVPRKQCQKCLSVNHLTHKCNKQVNVEVDNLSNHSASINSSHDSFCGKPNCMTCYVTVIANCLSLKHKLDSA